MDPNAWTPGPTHIAEFQNAGLVILNGAGFEKWASGAALPLSRVLDTARSFEKDFIHRSDITHSHGGAGAHSHTGVDGHTWLDPLLATRQAEQIMLAMARRWPEHEKHFRDHFGALAADLGSLHARLEALAPRLGEVVLISSHPAYAYLARRYHLALLDVHLPPQAPPSKDAANQLSSIALDAGGKPMIVLFESDPSPKLLNHLSALGFRAAVFDPCESAPDPSSMNSDYLGIMSENIDRLAKAVTPVIGPSDLPH